MKKYFSRITSNYYSTKNNLHKAVRNIADDMERRIIDGDQLTAFKNDFKRKIKDANNYYTRCKPVKLEIWSSPIDKDRININVSGIFYMELILAK